MGAVTVIGGDDISTTKSLKVGIRGSRIGSSSPIVATVAYSPRRTVPRMDDTPTDKGERVEGEVYDE